MKFLSLKLRAIVLSSLIWATLFFSVPQDSARAAGSFYLVGVEQSREQDFLAVLSTGFERLFEMRAVNDDVVVYRVISSALNTEVRKKVLYAEPENKLHVTQTIRTNDPGFTTNPLDIDKQWGLSKVGFTESWERSFGSVDNIVAVIDTGVDQTHEDLKEGHYVTGYNVLISSEIKPGVNSDDNGHGTLVAGVIGATPNNNKGITGTNWNVSIMPIKALDAGGSGSSGDVAKSIVWAADHGAHIINMSIGGIGFAHDTTLANAISYAYGKNVVIVAAAGNDGATNGGNIDENPVFPICDDNGENMVLGVVALDQNDVKPAFSNFGKACVDVAAPGKRILSTINRDPITGQSSPHSYAYASGTSLAVPFVAGQAALIRALYPYATNAQIRDRIITTADSVDSLSPAQCLGLSCKGYLGSGRINVLRSIQEEIEHTQLLEGDVVRAEGDTVIYLINGGKKQPLSSFVQNQRFPNVVPRQVPKNSLDKFPEGSFAEAIDGTLVKEANSPTVFMMQNGLKMPITGQVFTLRKLSFENVRTVTYPEINSWITGSFLTPPEGTLIKTERNHTVYWVVGGSVHAVNKNYYDRQGLKIFPVILVPEADLKSFSRGEQYIY